ncbi:MAG: hypothetical protein JWM80_453 [Cyanobacteria bacterium RYN_339]|nr:hypothetical protein [Cyanobacteria bacterium RYN_339]
MRPTPWISCLTAWLLAAAPALAEAPQGPPEERRLDVFYTGFSGGLASGRLDFAEVRPLFQPELPRDFEAGGFVADNVFRRDGFVLYTEHGPLTLEDFQAFFAHGPIAVEPAGELPYLSSDFAFVVTPEAWPIAWLLDHLKQGGGFGDAYLARGKHYRLANRDGLRLDLLGRAAAPPAPGYFDDPTRWEMCPAGTVALTRGGKQTPLLAVGRTLGDGLRRSRLLQDLRKATGRPALTVDVGNILDPGYTQLSRDQREFTLLRLASLGYDAVVPAETELGLSDDEWGRLAAMVPLLAANLTPRTSAHKPLPGHLIVHQGGLKLALIGLVDDHALELRGAVGPQAAWQATEAIAAARKELEALQAEAPDVTLVLTNVRDERLAVMRQLPGVTAVLADFDGLPGDVFSERVEVGGPRRVRIQRTFMVAKSSPNRVGRLEAIYDAPPGGRPEMRALRNEAHLVTDELPEDEGWRWQLNVTLDRYQAARRVFLLPDLREAAAAAPDAKLVEPGTLPALDRPRWTRLVANTLRQATAAEIAITRELPVGRVLIGPVPQLSVESWLDVGDRVVTTSLTGKALKQLVDQDADTHMLAFSGFDPVAGKVMGADISDVELYRVTTTDMVARHALFEATFAKRPIVERQQSLRELVLAAFLQRKHAYGDAFTPPYMREYAQMLQPQGLEVEPRWVFQLDDGQLLLNNYDNTGNAPFQEVRNTRVTTPGSFALGGKGRFSGLWDSRDWAWENRAKATYKRATLHAKTGEDVTQDAEDEAVLSSELRLKFLHPAFLQAWSPTPFVNTSYTTEFVPDVAEGVTKPRRAELNAGTGIVLYPGLGFKELRAGLLLKDDLARPGYLEPGTQLGATFEHTLETLPVTVKAGLDLVNYLPTPTDGPDRLGWQWDASASLSLPVWERFTLSLGADYFLYRGKVPATMSWASSLDFKIGLGYSLAFKPFYGIWF